MSNLSSDWPTFWRDKGSKKGSKVARQDRRTKDKLIDCSRAETIGSRLASNFARSSSGRTMVNHCVPSKFNHHQIYFLLIHLFLFIPFMTRFLRAVIQSNDELVEVKRNERKGNRESKEKEKESKGRVNESNYVNGNNEEYYIRKHTHTRSNTHEFYLLVAHDSIFVSFSLVVDFSLISR